MEKTILAEVMRFEASLKLRVELGAYNEIGGCVLAARNSVIIAVPFTSRFTVSDPEELLDEVRAFTHLADARAVMWSEVSTKEHPIVTVELPGFVEVERRATFENGTWSEFIETRREGVGEYSWVALPVNYERWFREWGDDHGFFAPRRDHIPRT